MKEIEKSFENWFINEYEKVDSPNVYFHGLQFLEMKINKMKTELINLQEEYGKMLDEFNHDCYNRSKRKELLDTMKKCLDKKGIFNEN